MMQQTLVLNASFEPLAIVNFRRAMILLMKGRANILQSDPDHPVLTVFGELDRPSVIILTRYVKVAYRTEHTVTRRGVLLRDHHKCGYCAKKADTIDHIIPKSRGGEESWLNLVACCDACNIKKGDKTLSQLGWELLIQPFVPRGLQWQIRGYKSYQPQWQEFLSFESAPAN